jgi:hypothetical protein
MSSTTQMTPSGFGGGKGSTFIPKQVVVSLRARHGALLRGSGPHLRPVIAVHCAWRCMHMRRDGSAETKDARGAVSCIEKSCMSTVTACLAMGCVSWPRSCVAGELV